MSRASLCLVAAASVSCASPPVVIGPHANRLTADDVREITESIQRGWEISGPSVRILVVRPDRVIVDTRQDSSEGTDYSRFVVLRRNGRWIINKDLNDPSLRNWSPWPNHTMQPTQHFENIREVALPICKVLGG